MVIRLMQGGLKLAAAAILLTPLADPALAQSGHWSFVASSPAVPILPREEFTSAGTIPAGTTLDVTLAVPKGMVVKIPLEANKSALGVSRYPRPSASANPADVPSRYGRNGWLFGDMSAMGAAGNHGPSAKASNAAGRTIPPVPAP